MTMDEPKKMLVTIEDDEVREACRLCRIGLKSTAVVSVFRAGLQALQRQETLAEKDAAK